VAHNRRTVEPVCGQIKAARGFRQFYLRGKAKVRHEWALISTVRNLLKLAGNRPKPRMRRNGKKTAHQAAKTARS
jgi:hypothetical protein